MATWGRRARGRTFQLRRHSPVVTSQRFCCRLREAVYSCAESGPHANAVTGSESCSAGFRFQRPEQSSGQCGIEGLHFGGQRRHRLRILQCLGFRVYIAGARTAFRAYVHVIRLICRRSWQPPPIASSLLGCPCAQCYRGCMPPEKLRKGRPCGAWDGKRTPGSVLITSPDATVTICTQQTGGCYSILDPQTSSLCHFTSILPRH